MTPTCPRCDSEQNTGFTFLCGTMVVSDRVLESAHCALRQLSARVERLESGLPRKTPTEAERYHRARKILDEQEPRP